MRITKTVEERRNEILDVASVLFATKGYDNTSTNDILDKIGIARGTLYYHFKSKEDILDSVIERMMERTFETAREVADDKSIPLLDRIPVVVKALNTDAKLGKEVSTQMHKPQNALMQQKVADCLIEGIVPIVTELIEEGVDAGMFKTVYADECAEMIVIYVNTVFDGQRQSTSEQDKRRIEGFIYNMERMLGTKRGFLRETINKIFK